MWLRINSPFLPDTDESDYLIEQYQDIMDVCNATMPPSLIRALPAYANAPAPTYIPPGTGSGNVTASSNGSACAGQTIVTGNTKRDETRLTPANFEITGSLGHSTSIARIKRTSIGSCDFISQHYGVTTGDVQSITGTDDCSFGGSSICVPLRCQISQVKDNDTWSVSLMCAIDCISEADTSPVFPSQVRCPAMHLL